MKKNIYIISFLLLIFILIFSISNIYILESDNEITSKEIEKIKDKINSQKVKEEKMNNSQNLNNLDFNELNKINNDTVGWIKINGTNIDYPIVQYKDNDYYLNHSFEKKKSKAGWIFLDYRNNKNFTDKNTIIYGHNRFDKSMFGSLKNLNTKIWYNNTSNHIIKLSNGNKNTSWQVFSVYKIKTTNDYLITNFNSEIDYSNFIKLIKNRSNYNFNVDVNSDDRILTLSTCSGSKNKLVVHAKLINVKEN